MYIMNKKMPFLHILLILCTTTLSGVESITITTPANASTVTSAPISITGTSSLASTPVKLTVNTTIIGTTTTNGLGNWNFTLPSLFNGSYSLTAELLDSNYEVLASDTNTFTMNQYTILITSPADDEIIFLSPAPISGTTSLASGLVNILLDGSLVATTTADANGTWDTSYSFTSNGAHTIVAQLIVANSAVADYTISVTARVPVTNATDFITSLGVGTNGQVLIAATLANPAFADLTSANSTISFTQGANSLNLATGSAVATSFITDSGTVIPVSGAVNLFGTANVHTSGSGMTVTVTLDGSPTFTGTITTNNMVVSTTLTADGNIVLPAATAGQSTAVSRGLIELGGANINSTNINIFEVATRNMFAGNYNTVPNVSGTDNIALGTTAANTLTTANNTISIGSAASATATDGIALGDAATASAARGIAIGSRDSTSSGAGPTASTNSNTIAIGSANSTRAGASATGQSAIAIGVGSVSQNIGTISIGAATTTVGGNGPSTANEGDIAIGSAQGGNTGPIASGGGAIAIGSAEAPVGVRAGASAQATRAIAIGSGASASTNSTAIGTSATASANRTIGIGFSANASGANSYAIGESTTASGTRSAAIGFGASTAQDDAIVLGNPATAAVRVGIGTSTPSAKLDIVTTSTDPLRLSGNLASSLNDFVTSINATGFVKTSNVPINALTNGNVVRVDQVFGNDATGARNGPPCATIIDALTKAQSGDTVWIFPGTYNESFTIPIGVTVRGLSQTGVVISTAAVGATDLVTMGTSSALSNVTLTLTSNAAVQLRGIVFPDTTSASASVTNVTISVDNSGAGNVAANVYGVHSTGTGTPAFSFINLLDSTIVVTSAGTSAKRGILVDAANSFNVRECTINVSNSGAGSAIGIETNNASAVCRVNDSSISGTGTSSADISKTLGTLSITTTDLVNSNANTLSFTTEVAPATILWSFTGNAPGAGTYFLSFGDATPTANAIAMRINQPMLIQNLSIRSRIGPSAGTTHTFTVFRNGVATTLSAVLPVASPSIVTDTTEAIAFSTGDNISLQYVRVGGGTNPADLVATVDAY